MGRSTIKKDTTQELHHPWCKFVAMPREGREHCERLQANYPFLPGETEADATARYFPQPAAAPVAPSPMPAPELIMLKRGRPVLEATEEMRGAHVMVQEAVDEIEILLREHKKTIRKKRKAEEVERVEEARTLHVTATRRRTRLVVFDENGHKRTARKVKTIAGKLEKDGKLPRDLAQHLYAFAQRVADGMGVASDDYDESTNRLTGPYEPVATLSGYGSRTPSDRQLMGLTALQEMKNHIPHELMPIFNQIVDEEVAGHSPLARTLAELGEALGYKHKQTFSAGGALVYAVTCLIAHYMRGRGRSPQTLRETAPADAFLGEI